MNQLVIFKTHLIDEAVISEYNKIIKSGVRAIMFIDNRKAIVKNCANKIVTQKFYGLDVHCYLFDGSDFEEYNLPYVNDFGTQKDTNRVVWCNGDYSMYIIRKNFTGFDYYWQLEYDVYYNDIDYLSFFAAYEDNSEDLLGPIMDTPPSSWVFRKGVGWLYADDNLLHTFFPAIRLSGNALDRLYERRIETWNSYINLENRSSFRWPHCEFFVPMEVSRNRGIYNSLNNLGIFNFRPFVDLNSNRIFLSYDKKLYHPVKNLLTVIADYKKAVDQLQADLVGQKSELEARRQADLAAQKSELEARRQADLARLNGKYVNSLSWRVTAPLRAVGRFLKARKIKTKE